MPPRKSASSSSSLAKGNGTGKKATSNGKVKVVAVTKDASTPHANTNTSLRRILKTTQVLSGIFFSGFTILHLATHTAALWGLPAANFTLTVTRWVYQKPIMEVLFALSALAHVLSSSALKVVEYKMYKNDIKSHEENEIDDDNGKSHQHKHRKSFIDFIQPKTLHQITGRLLSLFLIGHVYATRFYPWMTLTDPSVINISYIVLTIRKMPAFVLYLGALTLVGVYHMLHGLKLSFHYLKWTMYPKSESKSDSKGFIRRIIEGGSSFFHDTQRVKYMTSMITMAVFMGVLVLAGYVYELPVMDPVRKVVYLDVMRGYTPEWVQNNVWRAV